MKIKKRITIVADILVDEDLLKQGLDAFESTEDVRITLVNLEY